MLARRTLTLTLSLTLTLTPTLPLTLALSLILTLTLILSLPLSLTLKAQHAPLSALADALRRLQRWPEATQAFREIVETLGRHTGDVGEI